MTSITEETDVPEDMDVEEAKEEEKALCSHIRSIQKERSVENGAQSPLTPHRLLQSRPPTVTITLAGFLNTGITYKNSFPKIFKLLLENEFYNLIKRKIHLKLYYACNDDTFQLKKRYY